MNHSPKPSVPEKTRGRGIFLRSLLWAGLVALVSASILQARIGLMSHFVDVVLDGLMIGGTYDVGKMKKTPFTLTNPSQTKAEIEVTPLPPSSLKPGYEPIPDVSWVQIVPSRFSVGPGESAAGTVLLRIPEDKRWKGRHFQVSILSRTLDGALAVGLQSSVRFSIETAAPATAGSSIERVEDHIKFDSEELYLNDRREEDGVKRELGHLRLVNKKFSPVRLKVSVLSHPLSSREKGYAPAPNPGFLVVEPKSLEIPAGADGTLTFLSQVPSGRAHAGQKYAFLLRCELEDEPKAEPFSLNIYLHISEK